MKKTTNQYKTIGIIGGMGPEATADLYLKIVDYFRNTFGAQYDQDFPLMVINSIPIPDVVKSIENEEITLQMLIRASQSLERDGCDFVVIACNSVQFLLDKVRNRMKVPVLGIAEIVLQYIKVLGYQRVGILATQTTLTKGVYDLDADRLGVSLVKPEEKDQKVVTEVIMNKLAGRAGDNDMRKMRGVIKNLRKRGVEGVLLACTELPLIVKEDKIWVPIIDCTRIYAEEVGRLSVKANSNYER